MKQTIENINIDSLSNSWTAVVRYNNGHIGTIWHTAWPSTKDIISEILSISSDYPRFKKLNNQ